MPPCPEPLDETIVEKIYAREEYNDLIINNPGLVVMPRCLRKDLPLLPWETAEKA